MQPYVSVVPLARLSRAGKPYTYAVPPTVVDELRQGQLVTVPFQNRTVTGVVFDVPKHAPEGVALRELAGLSDAEPVLAEYQMRLALWISSEYRAPLSDVLGAMLPPAMKKMAGGAVRPSRGNRLMVTASGEAALQAGKSRSATRRSVLELLQRNPDGIDEQGLLKATGCSKAVLRALESSGLVERLSDPESAVKQSDKPHLSKAQADAVAKIIDSLNPAIIFNGSVDGNHLNVDRDGDHSKSKVFLLHGVTGSGKTEVYMAVIQEGLNRGAGAIVMVPEISLTPQAQSRFTDRFPGLVATTHSGLSPGARRSEWERLRSGEARIAVGPRSALFGPLSNIGVIIVDEEHDPSYKQGESPRYHARDVAIKLGEITGAPVVLGSATPDVCSYYRARKGRYTLLSLPERPVWDPSASAHCRDESGSERAPLASPSTAQVSQSRPMPSVEIVDLRQELKAGNRGVFSRSLLSALKETVDNGHQALLFLNRRGNATSVVCRTCGYVAICRACDIPLTYHSANKRLMCHRCDRRFPSPSVCPSCGGGQIRYLGIGTQRVAEEVSRALPNARVLRWDRDVTGKKGAHEEIAGSFERHEADILVGTQLITKGLDFPLVTLVGVVVADVGMNFPDFRSAERTFQLMTQVAGRAGRADLPSRVVVQSYNPEHYALQAAREHDYWSFYRQEMTFRYQSRYPPYNRLVRFLFQGKKDGEVGRRAYALRDEIASRTKIGADVQMVGPAPSFVARVDSVYHWHMLVLAENVHALLDNVPDDVIVDVDPVDVL